MPSLAFNLVWNTSKYLEGRPPKFEFKTPVTSFFCGGHNHLEIQFMSALSGEFESFVELGLTHWGYSTAEGSEGRQLVYAIELSCGGHRIDIFKALKRRFGENVKVSVTFTSCKNQGQVIASTGQMSIKDSDGYLYKCASKLSPMSWRDVKLIEKAAIDGQGREKLITLEFHFPESGTPWIRNPPIPKGSASGETSPFLSNSKMEDLEQVALLNKKIFQEALCTNVIVTCKDGAKVEAHRSFLSASSPVFETMFKNETKESLTGQLDMSENMSEKGVKAFLSYLYTRDQSVHEVDTSVAFEVMRAGHHYEISALVTAMITRLEESEEEEVGVGLAFQIYTFVKNLDQGSSLKEKSIKILKSNWEEWQASPEYRELWENKEATFEMLSDFAKY